MNASQVLLEKLARSPVPRKDVDRVVRAALGGPLCRCTGYVRYHEVVRELILSDAQLTVAD